MKSFYSEILHYFSLTLHIMQGGFFIMIQEFAAEEFASKMFSLHKSAIFYHSYFVRVKLDPFCQREQTFIGKLVDAALQSGIF